MKNMIESDWRELQKKLPDAQVFYLFVMLIVTKYQEQQRKIQNREEKFTQERFRAAFFDVLQYDLKEAVWRFCEKVDWFLVEGDGEIQKILSYAEDKISFLFYEKESVQTLDSLLENVLELAGSCGEYVATPSSIQRLVEELLSDIRPEKMADFCCGIAGFGVKIWEKIGGRQQDIFFYGADIDAVLCDIGKIVLFLHGITGRIERKDLLAPPEDSQDAFYDLIVLDIPRGNNKSEFYNWKDVRIEDFDKKMIYSDWIFIQDVLYHLKDGGYAAVLSTSGALIRANEKILREKVVLNDWLEAVITLPENLYPNTRTGTELLIFHKGKPFSRRGQIFFADISRYYFREKRNAYTISEKGQELACAGFKKYREIEGISVIKKSGMLDLHNFSLKPVQYLQQESEAVRQESICLSEIAEIVRGAQILSKDINSEDGAARFINIKDIQNERILYDTAEKINPSHSACKEKYRIQEDDILITSKGTVIKMAIVEPNPPVAFISGNITMLRVRQKYHSYVLFHYLNSEQGRAALERIQSGTTIRILNNTNLKELRIPAYNQELMQRVGTQLKKKQNTFWEKQKALVEKYQTEKRLLLELLEEDV